MNFLLLYACNVWMKLSVKIKAISIFTGNFSFFWIRKDFSPWRLMKMLFRLNFLVIFVCAAVDNEYMLYYICVMHTYW